jgi:hypothetical protein
MMGAGHMSAAISKKERHCFMTMHRFAARFRVMRGHVVPLWPANFAVGDDV